MSHSSRIHQNLITANISGCTILRCHLSFIQVNHLGPVLLTLELLPCVLEAAQATGDSRVVFVSSAAHLMVKWEPENFSPVSEEGYARFKMYGWTKLYNVSRPHTHASSMDT